MKGEMNEWLVQKSPLEGIQKVTDFESSGSGRGRGKGVSKVERKDGRRGRLRKKCWTGIMVR